MAVRTGYDSEMARVRQVIAGMGGKALVSVRSAIDALVLNDPALADLSRQYEKEIDLLYQTMDEELIRTIATQQPLASDLRFIVSSLKIASEVERIADYGNNIAKIVQKKLALLDPAPVRQVAATVAEMAQLALAMLADAIKAYEDNDADLATEVIRRDADVNALNKALFRVLAETACADVKAQETILQVHTAIRYIERVADRSTNVAEWVFYSVTGYRFKEKSKL
ncbi:MAG: phosphate signaling complex protein PhoU [Sporomusaceae bacterium]|nr:phosphate signaling complex protein PhoU [Sporomusaceae bacterium]